MKPDPAKLEAILQNAKASNVGVYARNGARSSSRAPMIIRAVSQSRENRTMPSPPADQVSPQAAATQNPGSAPVVNNGFPMPFSIPYILHVIFCTLWPMIRQFKFRNVLCPIWMRLAQKTHGTACVTLHNVMRNGCSGLLEGRTVGRGIKTNAKASECSGPMVRVTNIEKGITNGTAVMDVRWMLCQ